MRRTACAFALALGAALGPSGALGAGGSGIVAAVQSSPTCPVERMPPDPACAPKPFDAVVRVVRLADGHTVARVRTGGDGRVRIRLRPARYRVYARPASGAQLPHCSRQDMTVRRARYARATFDCDSGIR